MARVRAESGEPADGEAKTRFWPMAFEPGGAWGESTKEFFTMVKQMARARSRSAELYSWSAMNWANHWQQRVGVELARGRARVIERGAAPPGSRKVDGETMDWDPHSCC